VKWLGREGASEEAIEDTEKRLNLKFPPSYRQFMKFSNGWSVLSNFVGGLRRVEDVELFSKVDPFLYEIEAGSPKQFVYKAGLGDIERDSDCIPNLLQIGDPVVDAVTIYMCPKHKNDDEFEVWEFIPWAAAPVMSVYDSFWDFMQATYKSFKEFNPSEEE
jgi:hypothetical protein